MAVTLTVPNAESRSAHVPDASIQPFLQDDFDPADYLNTTLPALSSSTTNRSTQNATTRPVPLPELSSQLQTLLAKLNAQTSRLSNTLTQLTDEILRSGGRLAYEVEVLRGETIGLTDSLDNGLKKDIEVFTNPERSEAAAAAEGAEEDGLPGEQVKDPEPEYLTQLKTLTAVRIRLDSVIKIFGEAMQWPLAPSDLSLTSSLISVSAPETGDDSRSREEKGKAYVEQLRTEINDLLGSGNDPAGLEAASVKIDELKQLAEVWKGTAEEKARLKLVDNLQKPVEERQKALGQIAGPRKPASSQSRAMDYRYGNLESSRTAGEGGYGFLQNLRNLKNDMYLD